MTQAGIVHNSAEGEAGQAKLLWAFARKRSGFGRDLRLQACLTSEIATVKCGKGARKRSSFVN